MLITPFDPWQSKLCTCKPKYSLSPYVGCGHACVYCYARSYIKDFDNPRPKKDFLLRLQKEIRKIDKSLPISIANSSDPYQPLEEKLKLTRYTLKILSEEGVKVLIVTKSDLVARDVDILEIMSCVVSLTITTLNEELARKIEPNAPTPSQRVEAIEELSSRKIPVIVRIDPIIPFLNDNIDELEKLIRVVAEAGAKHIVSSTLKVNARILKNISKSFPSLARRIGKLYKERKEGYYYLPERYRLRILRTVANLARKYSLTFACCREGLTNLNTALCDGQHLLKK